MKKHFIFVILITLLCFACSESDECTNCTTDGDVDIEKELSETDTTSETEKETELEQEIEAEAEETVAKVFAITHAFPPTTKVGDKLDYQFDATNGTTPYSGWKVILGDLPEGTSLDENSGKLTGTPQNEDFYYFVIEVKDSDGNVAKELFGIRIGDPATEGALSKKAKGFQDVYEKRHFFNGFSYDCIKPDAPDGNIQLTTMGDAAFVSGQCTMAMAFREAVLRNDESFKIIKQQVEGWRFFQRLTGVPGLIGRSFAHKDDPFEDEYTKVLYPDSETHKGEGEFADYYWRGDTSRDQLSGAVLGMAMAYDLIEDAKTKEIAATFLTELADHLWDHDLTFFDPDGKMTKYGDISGERLEGFPISNGQSGLASLAWLKIAHHVSGEERFKKYYEELMYDRDYLTIIKDFQWVYAAYNTRWFNAYISWENFYHLMRLEQDQPLRDQLKEIFRDTLWLNTKDETPNRRGIKEHNPVKTPWYLYSTETHDPESLYYALWQINVFSEAPLRDRAVKNSEDKTIEKNPDRPSESLYPLPANKKKEDMVIWHRSPFDLDGGSDAGRERTGCDYMLPYWMARYYGYVNAEW